jgi:hypothetical protein
MVQTQAAKRKPGRNKTQKATVNEGVYQVVLRTDGATIAPVANDRVLYPKAVAWNRLLSSDLGRQSDAEKEKHSWRASGKQTILDLARAGNVTAEEAQTFINAAAESGRVQVELEWESEDVGYAARIFPWEALISLATKQLREAKDGDHDIVVVRWLKGLPPVTVAAGPVGFAVSGEAEKLGFNTVTERAAIKEALRNRRDLIDLKAKSVSHLSKSIESVQPPPSVVHYIMASADETTLERGSEEVENPVGRLQRIAKVVAQANPELAAFSTCHSGRRLAPLALASGAGMAIGFHGWVTDAACPVFFGAYYHEWLQEGASPLEALRKALAVNRTQPRPDDLGVVTLWSSTDLLALPPPSKGGRKAVRSDGTDRKNKRPMATVQTLHFDCELETSLNYSMLHNKSGGVFKRFHVTKLASGKMDDLEVSVKFDNGIERAAECRFFVPLREEANSLEELAARVMLPLGSELLRRRGEMIRGTVEITIRCGAKQVYHKFDSIELPPCDEWKDDEAGRRFLPSFIFPRDPAIRDILTAAQPFLRALTDDPIAGFDGYQGSFVSDGVESVRWQLRAIWTALQTTYRLDYVNPPPSYIGGVQRLRTPEEVLRSRRGTCIELALLLAACWEHIGVHPVLLLIPGHAFAGYWTSDEAWKGFFDKFVERAKSLDPSKEGIDDEEDISGGRIVDVNRMSGGGTNSKDQAWVLKGPHHLAMIHREVGAKRLIPVEATAVALQKPFGVAEREGTDLLLGVRRIEDFDAMIDGEKARKEGVTPLAILTQNVVA